MSSNQELDQICCISTWHKETNNLDLYNEDLNESKIVFPWNTGTRVPISSVNCSSQIFDCNETINSGPIGRRKLKIFLEASIQSNQMYNLNMSSISRILSDWRRENEIKDNFVMELVDFTKLCGIKKNKTYKDLFELLSKIFISKLKNKKILDDSTYTKFDNLALKCVKMINIPHLVESVITLLTKFNRLSDKVIKEITTPDLYLFPRFLSFYKLAPIKLRQQMWLRRPRWFVYEIIPFIMLFTKIFSSVDCYSILNTSNSNGLNDQKFSFDAIKDLLRSIQIDSKNSCDSDFKTEIDSFIFECIEKNKCCDLHDRKFSQQSNSIDSIYTFVSRIQSLYISCVELEHENIERLGESCKCLAFNFMDSRDFYKSFIQLQKNELLLPKNSLSASIRTNICSTGCNLSTISKIENASNHSLLNTSTPSFNGRSINTNLGNNDAAINSSCCNMTICGNILRLGRIVAYISYCIGNYKELYVYFINTLRQLYIDSLSHHFGFQVTQIEPITNINQTPVTSNNINHSDGKTFSLNSNIGIPLQPNVIFQNNKISKNSENLFSNICVSEKDSSNIDEEFYQKNTHLNFESKHENHIFTSGDKKQKNCNLSEQKLNHFSGESYLSSLRIFVALRIFHFNSKNNRSEEEEKKSIENEKSGVELNLEKFNQAELSNFEVLNPLAISECDAVAWPCIHIVGNILRDGFSSNKSQESLVNISSTLIIKSKNDLSDISFIFSEPHFLFICSEFILETSILTMFHSSMDAMLVLNPQRRKIPIALISLGLNSPYLSFKNKDSLLRNSGFLTNSINTGYITGPTSMSNINNQLTGSSVSQTVSPFKKATSNELGSQNNSLSTISRKRFRKNNDLVSSQNNINNNHINFAIRFDTLLNLLITFNFNNAQNKKGSKTIDSNDDSYSSNYTKTMGLKNKTKMDTPFHPTTHCHTSSAILSNILKLHSTVFSTFLPLIDRYLELSISSQKSNFTLQNGECEKKKSTRNELLKSIRNELIDYINSISALRYQSYSDILTLKFVRIISTSLFFTGIKPIIKQEGFPLNPLLHYSINGLSYYHSHHAQAKKDITICSLNNQIIAPSLPSCINLSIRLLETSFSSDWINQIFLKSIFGLLYTYPRIYNRFDNQNIKCGNEPTEMVSYINNKSSLFASIPNDIIHGLLLRVVLPSIKDPSVSSTEINTIHEIINDIEVCSIVDTKTKKIFIERFWFCSPFHFSLNILQDGEDYNRPTNTQKVQIKDLFQLIQNKISTKEHNFYLNLEVPYKTMFWEYHFIHSNDDYLLFQRWSLYFINICRSHDRDNQYYNKMLSISRSIQKIMKAK
ncbi:uncharacterized protein cubi_01383 [Cryptosporidium ubiquitum]|uniref:Uncharacterized protein n=1 Tax=Cryptosporidium ubiquitum TaxID=857276 RepID=A0A1J4MCT7_9CRYT|nr:uncharacterized protein cubi_01383 [Cryptosporidium ubiquitum]OII72050.1 hypothetical protein cubi_01383 [Cryptosporidium ubiquitum]